MPINSTSAATASPPTPANAVNADSHDGLRSALRLIESQGWDGSAGRAVLTSLNSRAVGWAASVDRRCGRRSGSTDPADVLSAAWCTMAKSTEQICAAQAPWAYLWTAVGNALASSVVADALLSDAVPRRPAADRPTRILRVGLETQLLDEPANRGGDVDGPESREMSPSMSAFIGHLAEGEPEERSFWIDAVERALDVMAGARRSYEEYQLRRDPYLRDQLGLTLPELSALAALMIGPRRGNRAEQSLLLALHRDPATPVDLVVGAARRLSVLRARHHGAVVATVVAAA